MEWSTFVILEIVVLSAWNSRIRHKILLNSTLCRGFKAWRLMILGWWRLRHLVGSWSWGRAVVQNRAKSSIRGVESRNKTFLKIFLIENILKNNFKKNLTYWRLFVSSRAWLLIFFSRNIENSFDFSRMFAQIMVISIPLLIKLTFWFIRAWTHLRWCGAKSLIMAENWPLKSILSRIEKLKARLLHLQIESRKFLITVVLSWPWYIVFRLKVLIKNFLFDRSFIICHSGRFFYLSVNLILTNATMRSTSHISPSPVH